MSLLGAPGADAEILAGGTDLLCLMKDYVATPQRLVNIKGINELGGITHRRSQPDCASARWSRSRDRGRHHGGHDYPSLAPPSRERDEPADPQHGNGGRRPLPAATVLVLPVRLRPAGEGREGQVRCLSMGTTATTPSSETRARRTS